MSSRIEIGNMITVGDLSDQLSLPPAKLIGELFKNGIMVTINEKIDFETAQIIVQELGLDVELVQKQAETSVAKVSKAEPSKYAEKRPPVVAVMGHVDHGKTSLLDAIRGEKVALSEAGGITQHISAYQIEHGDRKITFLDTPGHEAFAAVREHGALLTDVVVIVIAADDGIKPQTLEAIRFARKANTQIIVAITKIDKEGANIDRVKQQLAEQKMLPEDWGGDTIVVPLSSKTKEGIDKLLDMILLVADIEDIKADVDVPGEGLIIDSRMAKGRGPIAVVLVQTGRVKIGDSIIAGNSYAKVRALEDTGRKPVKEAGPSMPVTIIGFKQLPEFGDNFRVVKNEKIARQQIKEDESSLNDPRRLEMSGNDLLRLISRKTISKELNIIVKADVQGSLTSVIDSIKTLATDEVSARIIGSGVGNITDNDIRMAATAGAIVYGFQVTTPPAIKQLANRDKISVRIYPVIYDLLDDIKQELTMLLEPEEVLTELGRLIVRGIFKITKTEIICGGEVTKGKINVPSFADIYRDDMLIAKGVAVVGLKRGPTDTKEVMQNEMCGMSLSTSARIDLHEGDRIEVYNIETKKRTL